jgi:hypothetical protein
MTTLTADLTRMIPSEVVEAAAKEIAMTCRCAMACDWRDHLDDARAAIAAALEAWPGMTAKQSNEHVALFHSDPALILPLSPQENSDD